MTQAIFVLLMVIGGAHSQSGVTSIAQEFSSFENCEKARIEMEKAYPKPTGGRFEHEVLVRASKCMPK